jgi:hypothetical protein
MRTLLQKMFVAVMAFLMLAPLNSIAAFVSPAEETPVSTETNAPAKQELKVSKSVTASEVEAYLGRKMTGMEKLAFKLNKKKLTKALNAPAFLNERTNTWSIVGFITSFFIGPLGIVFSLIALKQIKETGERGHGLAIAGLILGIIGTILLIAALV